MGMKTTTKLWIGIAVLSVLSPLGLILPEHFKAGDAWGEWGTDGVKELIGYVPRGLEKLSGLWRAPLPDYAFKGRESTGIGDTSFAYISSAFIGIIVVVCIAVLIGKVLGRKE
jgi:cobalt/nickel transport protein